MLALQCPHLGTSHPIILSTPPLEAGPGQTRPSTAWDQAEIVAFSSHLPVPVLLTGQAPANPSCFLSGPPLSPALPHPQAPSKGPVCAADFHTRPLGAGGRQAGGLQFCSVGPPGLISMLPEAAGQKWWTGSETLPLGPKPSPASSSPSPSPLLASNRESLCAVEGRWWQHLHLCAEELGGERPAAHA